MARKVITCLIFLSALLNTSCQSIKPGESPLSMGTVDDIRYAQKLWSTMVKEQLVGSNALPNKPFFGGAEPHGMILELAYKEIQVDNHTGFVVVKKNYDGTGVSVNSVESDRTKFLKSMTVMYQREAGYDEDNKNWFWVKYKPDGKVETKVIKGNEIALAGRVIKGKTPEDNGGCISCHRSAGGGEYIFYPEINVPK